MEKKTVKKIELKEEELSKVVGGTTAFFGCKKLRKIHVLAEKPPVLGKNAFEGIPLNTEITVPAGSLDIYRQENVWKDYKRRIVASR